MPSAVSPPRQKRSAEKLDRLLDATESLLAERDFDAIGVQDIVRQAGTSVGVFYSRFADKEALLDALYDRTQTRMTNEYLTILEPEHWAGVPLREIISARVRGMIAYYKKNTGVLRVLVMRGHSKTHWSYDDPAELQKLSVARFAKLIELRKDEADHPNLREAAMLGYIMILGALREKILFGHSTARPLRMSDKRLAEELTNALIAYLGVR